MSQPREIQELVARIRPILTGREPSVQSAVIADLLAISLVISCRASRRRLRNCARA